VLNFIALNGPIMSSYTRRWSKKGFSRQITSDDGRTYQMPWAEYNGFGNLTSVQVRDTAKEAADSTGKQNAVFVTEAASRAWIGLPALASL